MFCYTDHPQAETSWTMVPQPRDDNPRLQAKRFKLLPHHLPELAGYDYTIWIDGSIRITHPGFAAWAVAQVKESGWAIFAHADMDRAQDEAAAMAITKKYRHVPVMPQIEHYLYEGFPDDRGLFMNGLIVRDMRNRQWQTLCDAWWEENRRWTLRDAISLPYVLWKLDGALDVIPGDITRSAYFSVESAHRAHEYDRNDP